MAIVFKKVEAQEFGFTKVGTFGPAVAGESISFAPKGLRDSNTQVAIFIGSGDNRSVVTCSKEVSKIIREALNKGAKQEELLRWSLDLAVYQNNDDESWLTLGMEAETKTFTSIKVDELAKRPKFDPKDLIAL